MTNIPSETPAVPVDLSVSEAANNQEARDVVASGTDDKVRTLFVDYHPDANGKLVGPDGEPAPADVIETLAKLNEHPNSGGGVLKAVFSNGVKAADTDGSETKAPDPEVDTAGLMAGVKYEPKESTLELKVSEEIQPNTSPESLQPPIVPPAAQ